MTSHLSSPIIPVDKSNGLLHEGETKDKHRQCVLDIQAIFDKGYSPENGTHLINYIQKQRSLLIEIMVDKFLSSPNPKMADAMNTLMGQMEKSVRDDRKEAMKGKELETSRETFELFSKSLNAVIDGNIKIPNYGTSSLILDPLTKLLPDSECKFKDGEFVMGHQQVNIKAIEEIIEQNNQANVGQELLP